MTVAIAAVTFVPDAAPARSYALGTEDVIWLAKSLWGECDSRSERECGAVAWTMLQRWMRWGNADVRASYWPTFKHFVRAFSEPVNPRKLDQGEPAVRARRAKIQGASWAEIPASARNYAVAFAEGKLPNPVPAAVDFAANWLVSKQGKTGLTIGGNTFLFPEESGQRWLPGSVGVDEGVEPQLRPFPVDSDGRDGEPAPAPDEGSSPLLWLVLAIALVGLVLPRLLR